MLSTTTIVTSSKSSSSGSGSSSGTSSSGSSGSSGSGSSSGYAHDWTYYAKWWEIWNGTKTEGKHEWITNAVKNQKDYGDPTEQWENTKSSRVF